MAHRNLLRSRLAAALSVVAVMAVGFLGVRPVPAGAAANREIIIMVSDTGFDPAIVSGTNVGDALIFVLDRTTNEHTVTFTDDGSCLGERGAVPCWPELRFDTDSANCNTPFGVPQHWRCLKILEPGVTVQYQDAFNAASTGQITVLGQPTTTTGPSTTTTTRPPTTTTTAPSTTTTQPPTTGTTAPTGTTRPPSTTTTAPTQIHPFVVPNSPSTTSTMAPPVSVGTSGGTSAPAASKDKGKDKGKASSKASDAETPTTVAPVTPDAVPVPDTVFDPSTLTPGPGQVPDAPDAPKVDDVNLESAGILNLLDGEQEDPTDYGPLLLALGALALVLSIGGLCVWFGHHSRYDPA